MNPNTADIIRATVAATLAWIAEYNEQSGGEYGAAFTAARQCPNVEELTALNIARQTNAIMIASMGEAYA